MAEGGEKQGEHPVAMNGPGTVNMKVMRMDVDIMYEAKMDHEFVNVSVAARTNNLELGTFFGWTYEGEKWN